MDLTGRTALVTGANRGLGRHIAAELLARGATVYAGARDPEAVDLDGVTPIRIDVTDPASIAAAAAATGDVSVLVNNAGVFTNSAVLGGDPDALRTELEVNYLGPVAVTRAFRPQLALADTSAVLNVLSVLSWVSFEASSAYSAAKSAAWAATNGMRLELAGQGTTVTALHVGYIDTDMAADVDAPKNDPADVARQAVDGIVAGVPEVLADEVSRQVQRGLAGGVGALYPQLAAA